MRSRAKVAERRGSIDQALAEYDRAFQPLWPPELIKSYFDLMRQTHTLRSFLAKARNANDTYRLFYYYQQQGILPSARRTLVEYRDRNTSLPPDARLTLARLLEEVNSYDDAAREYYKLYTGSTGAMKETALASLAKLLLNAADQPIRIGANDFSFYKDIATADPYPGFLNGILSLLFNSSYPEGQYATEEQSSTGWFHRGRASELIASFDTQFPKSALRPELHAKLLDAYAIHGDDDAVIRAGRQFLAAFPNVGERTHVALLVAESQGRKSQFQQEFATYDDLLKELAAKANGIPLGENSVPPPPNPDAPSMTPPGARTPARSPEYAALLERYIGRLVSMKRVKDALALYGREIDRNPNDPGLYERLAAFLEQNRLAADVEQVYRRAIQQFQSRGWYDKLARWYLRTKRTGEFETLTQEVVKLFRGSELEQYFNDVAGPGLDAVLYRQVNLYARQRFPHNLTFVRNLLQAYQRKETSDAAAADALLRNYWFYDDTLRSRYFERLASTNRLQSELDAIRKQVPAAAAARWTDVANTNAPAAQWIGEAEAWQSHFESAAPVIRAVADQYPGSVFHGSRAATLARSLGDTTAAATVEENLQRYAPRDSRILTRMGESYADRDQFSRARPYWNRIAAIEPGNSEGYREASTVFWDYYLFDDSLRIIAEGRQRFADPALFAYEAGAVYENKRDDAKAAQEYLKGALAVDGPSSSQSRLLRLATRPAWRDIIEKQTVSIASGANPPGPAITLRVAVLERQNRRDDLEKFLVALADASTSLDVLSRLQTIASTRGFDKVEERSLERQIAVTTDPVERMQARLNLARFAENHKDLAKARATIEAFYGDNPAILGVVRATVDFYWRNKDPRRAIDVLIASSGTAYPVLKRQFILEAARKATEAALYPEARKYLATLLQAYPFNSEYVAAMADTYARQNDDRGLSAYYNSKIQEVKDASIPNDEKLWRTAALRRSVIPVLTRLKDYTGAIDQYIEIVNRYPEDESLAREAAAYAVERKLQPRLRAAYTKASTDSPKDYRWPMVLARLESYFEDYPAAIAQWSKSIAIRPDRTDLYQQRAALEERLMRFPEAIQSYNKLYQLTYRNPQWILKVAEIQARLGQPDQAIAALRQAYLDGRPQTAIPLFEIARHLESWRMLPQAKQYAEEAIALTGKALLTDTGYRSGLGTYSAILTRLRQFDALYSRLAPLAVSEDDPNTLRQVLTSAAGIVNREYSDAEKVALAAVLEKQKASALFEPVLLPVAQSAGLIDLEVRWRYDAMRANPGPGAQSHMQRLIDLQRQRMRFEELAAQLEAYWKVYPNGDGKEAVLELAADAWHASGNATRELAVLTLRRTRGELVGNHLSRFLDLLLQQDRKRLVAVTGSAAIRNAAANRAVSSGDADLALSAVRARGNGRPPVWTKAYTALTGLHYSRSTPEIRAAFLGALGSGTIGERLGKPVDHSQQIAGQLWYYYGSRYGEYLGVTKQSDPEDYLPAMLEGAPGDAQAYFDLAEYYRSSGDPARALIDYGHALQLDPLRGDAHDQMAMLLWDQGKRDEATAHWKAAFDAFAKILDRRLTPAFWLDVRTALENIGKRSLLPSMQAEADRVLRIYIRRNGTYQVEPLLRGALAAGGADWLRDLARAAADPPAFLNTLVDAHWIPAAGREPLRRAVVEEAEKKMSRSFGALRDQAESEWLQAKSSLITVLLNEGRTQAAQQEFDSIPEEKRVGETVIAIRLAAQAKRLPALIAEWQGEPAKTPQPELLRSAAEILRSGGDQASARRLLEFVYTRALDQRNFDASNFLGLAGIRLENGDTPGAVTVLRRMNLVSGEPFELLDDAAELLERTGHAAEAQEFWTARTRGIPWDIRKQAPPAAIPTALPQLLDAIARTPESHEIRLAIFRAALAANQPQLAVSAMDSYLNAGGLRYRLQDVERATEQDDDVRWIAPAFLAGTGLDVAQRTKAAADLAGAMKQLDQLHAANLLYRVAIELQPSASLRAALDQVSAERARRAENDRRRPLIADTLQQANLVRPRVGGAR